MKTDWKTKMEQARQAAITARKAAHERRRAAINKTI